MTQEKVLVLIKPDAMIKNLYGQIMQELARLNLKMIGLKLVNVKRELAELHYEEHKGKPFVEKLIKHITGELHGNENVIAICYKGEDAITKVRTLAGKTNPYEAGNETLRGRFGRINPTNDCFENVIHASDSPESGERETSLWFNSEELIE
ncbi:nucleoside-diphosphate kinase [archaeon]|nr:nucleoside-diphosphate kinase [archaeon]